MGRACRWGVALALLAASGCAEVRQQTTSAPYPLPFGLSQVEGTEPRGRPAVHDEVLLEFRGEPVEVTRLQAAYAVTAEDPVAVFRSWVEQVAALPLPELSVGGGQALESGQWLQADAFGAYDRDAPPSGYAGVQLWTTEDEPVLLVDVSLVEGADGPPPKAVPPFEVPPRPESRVGDADAEAGDVLFVEQGDRVRLPDRTRALVPTLPVPAGTGGSASVLSAQDGEAALRAMLEEAQAQSDAGEVTGPTVQERDGVQVVTASYVIPAGGWGFRAVSVRGPDDPTATVHVSSGAD